VYLEDTHGENFRGVYRHFALSFHDKAIITAEATEAAAAQGKFWEMHDLIYERQQEWGQLSVAETQAKLVEYAEELELDVERFSQELNDHVYKEKVDADTQSAINAGLGGTPSYIVNGVVYPTQQLGLQLTLIEAFVRLTLLTPDQYTELPPQVIDPEKDYVATIRTSKGDIVVELYDDQAPVNVNSFVFLAQEKWYDDQTFFHVEPGFVAQSGDPTGVGLGFPYPGFYCGDETTPELTFDEAGMLALFTSAPGRNSSQFFITYAAQPNFSGTYTIIGRIIEGMDVAESLAPAQLGAENPSLDSIETILIEEK
jgi:cyclophilin family peptidyl-prolyl cis-trans isomerase